MTDFKAMFKTDSFDELERLRREQDEIDREIVQVLAKRIAMRRKITAFRSEHDLPTIDANRMEYVLTQAEDFAGETDVPPEMARQVFHLLIDWSHRLDLKWRKEKK